MTRAFVDHLFTATPARFRATDLDDWWPQQRSLASDWVHPVDAAIAGGLAVDRAAFAFAAGYQAALRHLIFDLPSERIACLCATESGGNRPRAIETVLSHVDDGWLLSGHKTWCLDPAAPAELLVAARTGLDETGRPRLKLVRLSSTSPGVTRERRPPGRLVPEAAHAVLTLDRVRVDEASVLSGDGYARYVKPFRTLEDIIVTAALTAYQIGVGRRFAFPRPLLEELAAVVVTLRTLALEPADDAGVHLVLSGVTLHLARLLPELAGAWEGVSSDERERWVRDRAISAIAAGAQATRRERAWQRFDPGA